MNRRELLGIGGGMLLAAGLRFDLAAFKSRIYGGWLNIKSARETFIRGNAKPFFWQHRYDIKGTGQNKQVLLWRYYEAVTGRQFVPRYQEIGDCVGQAAALGVDTLSTVQIGLHNKPEEWRGPSSSETLYAGSRIEIGHGKACFHRRCPRDGSTGAWVGEYARDYGTLIRGLYGDIDLREYRPDLAKFWGSHSRIGVPDELEVISKPHTVRTVTFVKSWDESCDLVANGYPIVLCSGTGFELETDSDGFLATDPKGWDHAMVLWGIDTKSKRPGGCIANSWGSKWLKQKQHKLGTPAGCFWADADVIDRMLQDGDSIALSDYIGYPRREELDYILW